jgi:hypothetical protein
LAVWKKIWVAKLEILAILWQLQGENMGKWWYRRRPHVQIHFRRANVVWLPWTPLKEQNSVR